MAIDDLRLILTKITNIGTCRQSKAKSDKTFAQVHRASDDRDRVFSLPDPLNKSIDSMARLQRRYYQKGSECLKNWAKCKTKMIRYGIAQTCLIQYDFIRKRHC